MRFSLAATLALALMGTHLLAEDEPKRVLRDDMTENYLVLPDTARTFSEIFTKSKAYGRLRMNYFYFENDSDRLHDPAGFGLGGSLLYKTAPYHGVSATAGLYTSQNLGLLEDDDALFGRTGKDTFSRYDRLQDGDWGLTALAQAYLQFHFLETDIRMGRQIFESVLTKSNDTKMIPNTFEGYTLVSNCIPSTSIKIAFLTGQKLRDHAEFHDVITYDDGSGETYSRWNNQDDAVVHKGLSHANLEAAGESVDNDLVIAGLTNDSIEGLVLDAWYAGVPELFHSLVWEANYEVSLSGGWSLTPGLRYMQQYDDGAGEIGGAALSGALVDGTAVGDGGYGDADSVDGKLYAARLLLRKGSGRLLTGYSKISDEADLIAPWRGFPTGGYTRSMAQYNWEAGTKSWMVLMLYDFGKAGSVEGLRAGIDLVHMDYDDEKERLGGHSKTDRSSLHADVWYRLPFLPDLEAKFRFGYADARRTSTGVDPSYSEVRFELNYLF